MFKYDTTATCKTHKNVKIKVIIHRQEKVKISIGQYRYDIVEKRKIKLLKVIQHLEESIQSFILLASTVPL